MCNGKQRTKPITGITPYKDRSCTDLLILLLWVAAWGGTVYVTRQAVFAGGNPNRIIRAVDLYGRICGRDEGVADLPLGAFPSTEHNVKICVASCDETLTHANMSDKYLTSEFMGLYCVPVANGSVSVSLSGDFESAGESFSRAVGDLKFAWPIVAASAGVALLLSFVFLALVRKFASTMVWTAVLAITVGGFFIAYLMITKSEEQDDEVDDDRRKMLKYGGYTFAAASLIFILVVIGMRRRVKIAVAVMKEASRSIIRMPGLIFFPIMPLVLAMGMFAFWMVATLYVYSVADPVTEPTPEEVTDGTSNPANMTVYERDTSFNNSLAYLFFHLLWMLFFILYFAFMVISGAVADDFFQPRLASQPLKDMEDPSSGNAKPGKKGSSKNKVAPQPVPPKTQAHINDEPGSPKSTGSVASGAWGIKDETNTHRRSKRPVCASLGRTCRFHTGTVAFGSLILAIVNFARAAVAYLEEISQKDNGCVKAIFCCVQCCLTCLHCIADKISKNSFVWCAVYGDNFLDSAYGSFNLIWANLAKFAAVSVVSGYILLLGKLLVAFSTTSAALAVFTKVEKYDEGMSSPVIPCIVIFLLAYIVCSIFMVIYTAAIDTIFLCFLIDFDVNKNGNMLSPPSLQKLVGECANESEKMAAHKQSLRSLPGVEAAEDTRDAAKTKAARKA